MSKLLNNVKIRIMIILGIDILLAAQLVMGITSILFSRSIAGDTKTLYERPHTNLVTMMNVKMDILEGGGELRKALISSRPVSSERRQVFAATRQKIDGIEANKLDRTAPTSDNMLAMMAACDAWGASGEEIAALMDSGSFDAITMEMQVAYNEAETAALERMDVLIGTAGQNAEKFMVSSASSSDRSTWILVVLFVLSIVVSLLVERVILRRIARPMEVLVRSAQEISSGRLDADIPFTSKNEFGVLADQFRLMQHTLSTMVRDISRLLGKMGAGDFSGLPEADYSGDFAPILDSIRRISASLSGVLGNIRVAADQVAVGAGQVSAGAQNLAQGSTEQASSIVDLSRTVEEISGHVQTSAKNAADANRRTAQAAREMEAGRSQMERLTVAIRAVSESAGKIGNIIKTIEDIAFQTNILALNAAVEAARAGAAGKGFAVVADEVRNLANKSAEAAKGTTALIEASLASVREGDGITQETAHSFERIADETKTAAELVENISHAVQEQSRAMGEITTGLEQISAVVQNNSATAEESAAASEELSGQAQALQTLTERFILARQPSSGLTAAAADSMIIE